MLNNMLKLFSCLFLIQTLIACSSGPKKSSEFIFYPAQPAPPKIQYLTSFSGPRDLEDDSSFGQFILGDEAFDKQNVVKPYGVSIKDGVIYLVDIRSSGYATFDLKQKKFNMVHGSRDGKMPKPINIFVDDENIFVADIKRQLVIVFDKNNEFVKVIGDGKSFKPSDVLVVDNKLFVTDLMNHQIHVYDKNTDKKLYSIGKRGSGDGELFQPTSIALSPDNHLYVSETGNFRIQEFTLDGKFVRTKGQVGVGLGEFARPKGINIDREGNIYVVDAAFSNVQIMNKATQLLMFFGEAGGQPENINLPVDVLIDYDHVSYFQKYAKPGFKIEYLILITSQFGISKLNVYGFGQMEGEGVDNSEETINGGADNAGTDDSGRTPDAANKK